MMRPRFVTNAVLLLILSESVKCFWWTWSSSPGNNGACNHQMGGFPSDRQGITPRYMGCYPYRSSDVVTRETSNRRMTHELCFGFCQLGMYRYAGIRNGVRCQCINELNPTETTPETDSNCNQRCPGDPNENQICGGENFITQYSLF